MDARRAFREAGRPENAFSYHVCLAVSVVVALLLIMGLAGHSLLRATWLWMGAFEGIALYIMKHERGAVDASDLYVGSDAAFEGLGHES